MDERFFRGYLSVYGVAGGWWEFRQIIDWVEAGWALYPDCFADWEPDSAFRLALQITDVGNLRRALAAYTKWKEQQRNEQEELYALCNGDMDTGSSQCKSQ